MIKVLIGGDKKFASVVSPIVKSCGAEIVVARSMRESIELHNSERPDFVLIQERFEDGAGEDLMNDLRKISPKIIVIVTINHRDSERALQWMDSGAYECLYEPLNPNEVRSVLRGALRMLSGTFLPKPTWWQTIQWPTQFSLRFLTLLLLGGAGLLAIFWGGQILYQRFGKSKTETVKEIPLSFRLPYPNPTGVTWDGKSLWVSDWSVQTVYKHKIDSNLTLEKYYPMSDIPTVSLTWGDSVLWTVGQDGNIRKHLIDGKLTVLSVVRVQDETPSALAWDGKNLWSCDAQSRKIYKHLPDENLTSVATYDFPGKNPVGMVWIGRDLWVGDEGTGTLYRLNFEKEVFTLVENLRPGVHQPGTNKLSGLCSDGKNLWTISEGNGLIFRHSLSTLRGG